MSLFLAKIVALLAITLPQLKNKIRFYSYGSNTVEVSLTGVWKLEEKRTRQQKLCSHSQHKGLGTYNTRMTVVHVLGLW